MLRQADLTLRPVSLDLGTGLGSPPGVDIRTLGITILAPQQFPGNFFGHPVWHLCYERFFSDLRFLSDFCFFGKISKISLKQFPGSYVFE